jgi:hypothetical protein
MSSFLGDDFDVPIRTVKKSWVIWEGLSNGILARGILVRKVDVQIPPWNCLETKRASERLAL